MTRNRFGTTRSVDDRIGIYAGLILLRLGLQLRLVELQFPGKIALNLQMQLRILRCRLLSLRKKLENKCSLNKHGAINLHHVVLI